MSLISGSNSLTPDTAGAFDFKAAIVEKALLEGAGGYGFEVGSKYNGVFVGVFAHKQREKDVCCCSCRNAVRLTVRSTEDMSEALTGHNTAINSRDGKTIGIHIRRTRQEELTGLLFGGKHLRSRKDGHDAGSTSALGIASESSETKQEPSLALPVSLLSFLPHNFFKFD